MYLCELSNEFGSVRTEAASFTLLSENYALKKPTEVSTSQTVGTYFHKSYVNDGISETKPLVNEGWTSNENNGRTEWVTVDMGEKKTISRVVIYPRYDGTNDGYGIPSALAVKVSSDNENWTTVYQNMQLDRPTEGALVIEFDATEARYVKVEGKNLRMNPSDDNRRRMQIAEIEIYNAYFAKANDEENETPLPPPETTPDTSDKTPEETPTETSADTLEKTPEKTPADTSDDTPAVKKNKGLIVGQIALLAIGVTALLAIGAGTAFFLKKKNSGKKKSGE